MKLYRVGRKQELAILDENGLEVALFREGYKNVAHKVCGFLNTVKTIQYLTIEAKIAENESILEMLEIHGDGRSKLVVRCRLEDLQEQLLILIKKSYESNRLGKRGYT